MDLMSPQSNFLTPGDKRDALSVADMLDNRDITPAKGAVSPRAKGSRRKRQWTGPVYAKRYFIVPIASGLGNDNGRPYVEGLIDQMFHEMPHPALLVYLKACRLADRRGLFSMSAELARAIRGSRRTDDAGDRYLRLLVESGLIRRDAPGGTGAPTEFTLAVYAPWESEQDLLENAIAVFKDFKAASRKRALVRGFHQERVTDS
jgi:hypothetical protein